MADTQQAIRQLSIVVDDSGVDQATQKLQALTSSESTLDNVQQQRTRTIAQISAQYASLTQAQERLISIYQQQQALIYQQAAANDNAAASSSHFFDVLRLGTQAAIAHTEAWLATAGAVGAGVLVFGSVLGVLGPIILAYKALKEAVDLATQAWELGGQQLDAYRKIAEQAAAVDLSTSYFQKLTKGAQESGAQVDQLTTALQTLQKQSADQLGGSALQQRLDASVKVGNFSGNSGVDQLAQANTTQEKYEAISTLIHNAMQDGQRLAALDIANTAFGPQAAANLRQDAEYFDKINSASAEIADKQLVSDADVGRALALKTQYDAAVAILEQRWHPVQDLLADLGVKMQATWIGVVSEIASAVDWTIKLVEQINNIPQTFWDYAKNGVHTAATIAANVAPSVPLIGAPVGAVANIASFATSSTDAAPVTAYSAAVDKLRALLQNQNAVQQAVNQTNKIAQTIYGDTSHAIDTQTKSVSDANDFVDRAINSLQKHVLQQQADTEAVGLGAGALAGFQARAAETAAVLANGGEETAEQAAKFKILQQAASDAADALARANVANNIKFSSNTALLSSTDVQIATQLKSIYPDVATALNSAEAAQLRFDTTTKEVSSGIQNDLVSGLTDITMGTTSASLGFQNMGLAILKTIDQMIIKFAIVNPMAQALQTSLGGGGLLSLFGLGGFSGAVNANGSIAGAVGATSVGGAPLVFAAAGGGTFGSGWGVVGEQGPELINVHSGGVTVIPNQVSQPFLPGFASGGSLSSSGNVRRLPGSGQDNSPQMVFNYAPNIDARGQDPSVVARLAAVIADDKKNFPRNVQSVVQQVISNKPGAFR